MMVICRIIYKRFYRVNINFPPILKHVFLKNIKDILLIFIYHSCMIFIKIFTAIVGHS